MKPLFSFLNILLALSSPLYAATSNIEYRNAPGSESIVFRLQNYEVAGNDVLGNARITSATVTLNRQELTLTLSATVDSSDDVEHIANYLTNNQCDFLFTIVIDGLTSTLNSIAGADNSNHDEPAFNDGFSSEVRYWNPIEVTLNNRLVEISCQGAL